MQGRDGGLGEADIDELLACVRQMLIMLSTALVEKITRRTSTSNARNGTNSAHASDHSFTIAGYFFPHVSANSMNRSVAASSVAACTSSSEK